MPSGIPYIVGNEAAERFSFYGMKSILFVFMTKYLLDASGQTSVMTETEARIWSHNFLIAGYTLPLIGAIVSDWLFGKYRTILVLSCLYVVGHGVLAFDETRNGLFLGLTLIAIGMGAIKPCVSAHVGDQFGAANQNLMSKVFGWFYVSINVGAAASAILIPLVLEKTHEQYGARIAFGIPGILMAVATFCFWLGRYRYIHVPPRGKQFLQDLAEPELKRSLIRLVPIYICVAAFWGLFDQAATSWVGQAEKLNLTWMGISWLPSQVQAVNPVLILILVPLFTYFIYPAAERIVRVTALRKIGVGLFLATVPFAMVALIESQVVLGEKPSIGWQIFAQLPMTMAEVLVSITCLEFSYLQAPKSMKSIVMSAYLLSIALGNAVVSAVNEYASAHVENTLFQGANYYWFFTGLMLVSAIAFVFVARNYRETPAANNMQDAKTERATRDSAKADSATAASV